MNDDESGIEEPKRFTFHNTYKGGGGNHYTICYGGRVQPFGAIFYATRGDSRKHVKRAVDAFNKALSLYPDARIVDVLVSRPGRTSGSEEKLAVRIGRYDGFIECKTVPEWLVGLGIPVFPVPTEETK